MPSQKTPGSLNLLFLFSPEIFSMSSLVRLKSKILMFSCSLSTLVVFGMIAVPLYTPHLKTIYAGVFEYFEARSFTIDSFNTDSYSVAIFSSK